MNFIKLIISKLDRAIVYESIIGSFVIAFGGLVTIPIAGAVNGVEISAYQGAGMGAIFFFTRPLGLYIVRYCFKRWYKE